MKNKLKVIMFASDFSKYGEVQAMKSTLEFLTKDNGCIFAFVNDPARGNVPKTKFELADGTTTTVTGLMKPNEMNALLDKMVDKHAV